jgi:hypothetical protein
MGYDGAMHAQDQAEVDAGVDQLRDKLTDRRWRLRSLYKVRNDDGAIKNFIPFQTQEMLYDYVKPKVCILKGRQMRVTTAYCTMWLDAALFNNDGLQIGIIAHTKGDASKIFKNKICAPYDNLPEEIRNIPGNRVVKRTESEIGFANGANISCGVSFRSGNLQVLHVTEYGYICARQPLRAEEIKTGAFIAAQRGITVVESTAMGQGGDFARICTESQKGAGNSLWNFKFLPWYLEPTYTADTSTPFAEHRDTETVYLNKLEAMIRRRFTPGQRRWYCLMKREYGEMMYREFPSTPEEAFKSSTEGAYYGSQMLAAWQSGRITDVPYDPTLPVETWWDIGGDGTAIWFVQRQGRIIYVIDFYQASGEGVAHYAAYVKKWMEDNKVRSMRCVGPHDLNQGRWSTGKTQLQSAADHGLIFEVVEPCSIENGIEAVRRTLPFCVFDESHCAEGIQKMERYRKKWNAAMSVWSDIPLHDDASHCADAFRTGVMGMQLAPIIAGLPSTAARSPARPIVNVKWK